MLLCTQGWDKTYCLRFVEGEYDEIHFFGDKTFPVSSSTAPPLCMGSTAGARLFKCAVLSRCSRH
jgi:hypothetical protein